MTQYFWQTFRASCVLFVALGLSLPAFAQTPNRPNIVFILADDLDAQQQSISYMPKLKELIADQGTTFKNFFVNITLCCPSRASILRGQYAHNTKVLTNDPQNGAYPLFYSQGLENSTMATWLKAAGYRTAMLGKYLNHYPLANNRAHVPPGWDEWSVPIEEADPYSGYNYRMNQNGAIVAYGAQASDYLTDVLSGKATDFIQRAVRDNKPFFVYLAPYTPHEPATPAPRHQNEFPGLTAPRPPSFNEAEVSDKPAWLRSFSLLTPRQIQNTDELYRQRAQSLLAIDEMIANIVQTLQSANALANTYIIFTSDNGLHMGEHRLAQRKQTPYEEAIHVPMLVRGPGVPAGQTLEHLAMNIDFAPTFAELAGAAAPSFVDGRSLVPLLKNNPPSPASWRQAALIEHKEDSTSIRIPDYQGLRKPDLLYVEYATGEREYYNLLTDPYQLQNQYQSANPALMAQLASELAKLRNCAGANCATVGVAERQDNGLPLKFELYQNYPNPFRASGTVTSPSTTIRFSLPQREQVTLKVFDLNGHEIATLIDGDLEAGTHSVTFEPRVAASSLYFYKITAGKFSQTRKAVLMK